MRASLGVSQEGTDALIQFGADDVFELASLAVRFVVVDAKCVFEEAFGQAVATNDISGATRTSFGEIYGAIFQIDEM